MIKKTFFYANMFFAAYLSIFSLNIITSHLNPNKYFPLIFVCLGLSNTLLGINLLNNHKKVLSFCNFILAALMFITVGSKIAFS